MDADKTGGPAFPAPNELATFGMTLLDYFAGQAMAGLDSENDMPGTMLDAAQKIGVDMKDYCPAIHWPKVKAAFCYDFAEAMLAERAKRTNG